MGGNRGILRAGGGASQWKDHAMNTFFGLDSEFGEGQPGIGESSAAAVEERREATRMTRMAPAKLLIREGAEPIACMIHDIGESGLFLHAPASSGIGVGQRYEVVLDSGEDACLALADAFSCGCYATVVRTTGVEDATEQSIGAGLRFDQPLIL